MRIIFELNSHTEVCLAGEYLTGLAARLGTNTQEPAPVSVAVEETPESATPDPGPDHELITGDGIWIIHGGDEWWNGGDRQWQYSTRSGIGSQQGNYYRRRKPVAPPTPEAEIAANWAKIAASELPVGFHALTVVGIQETQSHFTATPGSSWFLQIAMLGALMTAIHRQSGRQILFHVRQFCGATSDVDVWCRPYDESQRFDFDRTDDLSQIIAMQKAVLCALNSSAWTERKKGGEGK